MLPPRRISDASGGEPATVVLAFLGLAGLGGYVRRRRKA
jgi:MYXO-CTERM domain-containing protein